MESDQEKKTRERRDGGKRRWKDIEDEERELESWIKAVGDVRPKWVVFKFYKWSRAKIYSQGIGLTKSKLKKKFDDQKVVAWSTIRG